MYTASCHNHFSFFRLNGVAVNVLVHFCELSYLFQLKGFLFLHFVKFYLVLLKASIELSDVFDLLLNNAVQFNFIFCKAFEFALSTFF